MLALRKSKFIVVCVFTFVTTFYTVVQAADMEQETAVYSALSMGTAWAVTEQHVVTNYHVIKGNKNIRLVNSSQKEIPVKLLHADKNNDLAVLQILDKSIRLTPLPLASTKPRLGSHVFTVGYPHPNLMGTSPKLTSGFINATNGLADDPRTFQVSVPVQAGNSGGPLLNMHGEVVGIITSKLSAQKMFEWTGDIPQNVNYAIKISHLKSLIKDILIDETHNKTNISKNQQLESLAEKIVSSVIIVAGDGRSKNKTFVNPLFAHRKKITPPEPANKKPIIVYAYAEPGNYDLSEHIKGSDTVESYSRNTAIVLQQQIKKHLGRQISFISHSGENSGDIYYKIEKAEYNKKLCLKNNASNIVASYSEKEPGAPFRHVSYRMIDCSNLKEFKMEYPLERDETNDRFGYEVELYTSFKDFLLKTPPYMSWEKN